jgi:hypothetical protein
MTNNFYSCRIFPFSLIQGILYVSLTEEYIKFKDKTNYHKHYTILMLKFYNNNYDYKYFLFVRVKIPSLIGHLYSFLFDILLS